MPYIANMEIISKYRGEHIKWKPGDIVLGAENWDTLQIFLNSGHIRFVERAPCKEEAVEEKKSRGRPRKKHIQPIEVTTEIKETSEE